jgi:outer membrane protein assembly factor BamA
MMLDGHAGGYFSVDGKDFSTLLYGGSWVGIVEVFNERTIATRLVLEGAEPLGGQVPFFMLPNIGQGTLLRGYATGRLRDHVLTAANVEYRWPVAEQGDAFLFFDMGRVYPDLGSINLNDWKWGTGIGVRLLTRQGAIVSAQFSYSPDGIELEFMTGKDLF